MKYYDYQKTVNLPLYYKMFFMMLFDETVSNEFKEEAIKLVKETSIGAYIGIVELTKASDIIASRTYDYFFPLILIAIIYLIITLLLSKMISAMEKRLQNA